MTKEYCKGLVVSGLIYGLLGVASAMIWLPQF